MLNRFFRSFFWGILIASLVAWLYVGYVGAGAHEAVLIEDRLKGIEASPIHPGETRFIPARAYPNRITLHRVDIGPRVKEYGLRLPLPQTEVLDLDESFYVKMQTRFEYQLDVEGLYDLFSKLDQRNWDRLDSFIDLRLNDFFSRLFANRFLRNEEDLGTLNQKLGDYMSGDALKEMNQSLERDRLGIRLIAVSVRKLYVPDLAQYRRTAREMQAQRIERIKQRDQARASQEEESIKDQAYLQRLEHVGKLLREYPNLRDYLAVDRLGKNVQVMVYPYERWFSGDQEPLQRLQEKRRNGNGGAANAPANPQPLPGRAPQDAQGPAANRIRDLTPP